MGRALNQSPLTTPCTPGPGDKELRQADLLCLLSMENAMGVGLPGAGHSSQTSLGWKPEDEYRDLFSFHQGLE